MSIIRFPTQFTWYILGAAIHYGGVDSTEIMESPISEMETFLNEQAWLDALQLFGIGPEEADDWA